MSLKGYREGVEGGLGEGFPALIFAWKALVSGAQGQIFGCVAALGLLQAGFGMYWLVAWCIGLLPDDWGLLLALLLAQKRKMERHREGQRLPE